MITAKAIAGMALKAVDWSFKTVIEGTVSADGVLTNPADKRIFSIEFNR